MELAGDSIFPKILVCHPKKNRWRNYLLKLGVLTAVLFHVSIAVKILYSKERRINVCFYTVSEDVSKDTPIPKQLHKTLSIKVFNGTEVHYKIIK